MVTLVVEPPNPWSQPDQEEDPSVGETHSLLRFQDDHGREKGHEKQAQGHDTPPGHTAPHGRDHPCPERTSLGCANQGDENLGQNTSQNNAIFVVLESLGHPARATCGRRLIGGWRFLEARDSSPIDHGDDGASPSGLDRFALASSSSSLSRTLIT